MEHRLVPALVLSLTLAARSSGTGAAPAAAPNADGSPKELRIGYQLIPNGDLIVKDQRWLEQARCPTPRSAGSSSTPAVT
ncbi:hypothetical protein [Nonomuraea sp. JJY05]|jgi:taurine transport system substrate-binding protein|uniref:hypothetical protein n=1 Tax=Nonomuraea sp. JJY05 TaxID=3350255 RepID=UPI00373F4AB3